MNLSNFMKDFIDADDNSLDIKNKDGDITCSLFKKQLKDPNFYVIYRVSKSYESSDFSNYEAEYIGVINHKTYDFIHLNEYIYHGKYKDFLNDKDYNVAHKINSFFTDFKQDVILGVSNYFYKNQDKILEDFVYDDYKSIAQDYYKINKEPVEPSDFFNEEPSFDMLCDFFTDQDAYINKCINKYIDITKDDYTKFFFESEALTKYRKEILENPLTIRQNKILDIMNNDKYKNIRIYYKTPNDKTRILNYSKDEYNHRNIRDDILTKNEIHKIPIQAIEKIEWGRSTLYNTNDFSNLDYTKEDLINDFIKREVYNNLPKEYYQDKKFIEKIVLEQQCNFNFADESLKNDSEYIFELLKKAKPSFLNVIDDKITNKTFISKYLDYLSDNKINIYEFESYNISIHSDALLKKIPNSMYEDLDYMKKLVKIHGFTIPVNLCSKLSKTIINNMDFVDFIKEKANILDKKQYITKVESPEILDDLFTKDCIIKNIHLLDDKIIENENYIEYLFDKADIDYIGSLRDRITNIYKDNDHILNILAATIKTTRQAKNFISNIEIDYEKNKDRFFEFTSININFLHLLSGEDQEIYITSESSDITAIYCEKDCLFFKTPFGKIEWNVLYYNRPYFYDDNGHNLSLSEFSEIIQHQIKESIDENFPEYKGKTFYEIREMICDAQIEEDDLEI